MHAGGNTISARDLMDDDGSSSALEAFQALHHPERKATEKLLLTDGLRKAEQRKMRQYGHLVNESVGFMAAPFSAFGSTVPRVAKLLKGMAKRQKQDEVWNSFHLFLLYRYYCILYCTVQYSRFSFVGGGLHSLPF